MLTIKDILADKQIIKYIRFIISPDTRNYYDRWNGYSPFAPTPSDLMDYPRLHICTASIKRQLLQITHNITL